MSKDAGCFNGAFLRFNQKGMKNSFWGLSPKSTQLTVFETFNLNIARSKIVLWGVRSDQEKKNARFKQQWPTLSREGKVNGPNVQLGAPIKGVSSGIPVVSLTKQFWLLSTTS